MSAELFITKIWNRRRREYVPVFDANGVCLTELLPDQTLTLKTTNPSTLYAAWSEVRYEDNDEVTFFDRPGFEPPDLGRWVITMLNRNGRVYEVRFIGGEKEMVPDTMFGRVEVVKHNMPRGVPPSLRERRKGGQPIYLPRGIPRRIGVPATDELAPYERLEIKFVEHLRPRSRVSHYLDVVRELQDVLTPRSEVECRELQKELDGLMAQPEVQA